MAARHQCIEEPIGNDADPNRARAILRARLSTELAYAACSRRPPLLPAKGDDARPGLKASRLVPKTRVSSCLSSARSFWVSAEQPRKSVRRRARGIEAARNDPENFQNGYIGTACPDSPSPSVRFCLLPRTERFSGTGSWLPHWATGGLAPRRLVESRGRMLTRPSSSTQRGQVRLSRGRAQDRITSQTARPLGLMAASGSRDHPAVGYRVGKRSGDVVGPLQSRSFRRSRSCHFKI